MDSEFQPDIAGNQKPQYPAPLDWVGMNQVELPIIVVNKTAGIQSLPAYCDLLISLDEPESKGIHMSRLYSEALEFLSKRQLTFVNLVELSQKMIETHDEVSSSSCISVDFEYMLKQASLSTDNSGWRIYPVQFSVINSNGQISCRFSLSISYSSTCPCSAALSRQAVAEDFMDQFSHKSNFSREEVLQWILSESSQGAVPHAQRSVARVEIQLDDYENFSIDDLISQLESVLKTPVQSFVKREDEKEFARLNGSNMMFSEDAARILINLFEADENILDYSIHVEHQESLHPHNAVVMTTKKHG